MSPPAQLVAAPVDGMRGLVRDEGLRAIAAAYALGGVALASLGPAVASLADELDLSGAMAALHGSFFGLGLVLMGLGPGRRLARRLGASWTLRVAVLATAVGAGVFTFAHQVALTLPGAAAIGIAFALLVLAMPPVVRDHPAAGDHAFTDINALFALGAIAGPGLVAAAQAVGLSWRVGFGAATATAGGVALVLAARATLPEGVDGAGRASGLLDRPGFRLALAVMLAGSVTESVFIFWSAAFSHRVREDAILVGTLVVTAYMVGQAVGRLGGRVVARRVPAAVILPLCLATSLVGALLLVVGPGVAARLVGGLVGGLGTSLVYPRCMGRLFDLARDEAVAVGALAAFASGCTIALAPLAVGVLDDLVGLGAAMATLPLAALCALLLAGRQARAG